MPAGTYLQKPLSLPELETCHRAPKGALVFRKQAAQEYLSPNGVFLLISKPQLGRRESSLPSHPPSCPQHSVGYRQA